ncbi:hypothetical protein BD779DRAFT_1702538 [Infundibulicybe gibba]|nr:hypothetical protein BD779DRAFT_1702538 [Infundibulicybe gibba]
MDLAKAGGLAKVQEEDPQMVTLPPLPSLPLSNQQTTSTSFLHKHNIPIVNVGNLVIQPYNKDNQYILAFMSEIVSVFGGIAELNPLFRQITNFSINQVASNAFNELDKLADFAAAIATAEVGEL